MLRAHGVVVNDDIVINEARHFWADVSSPAVTSYNHHQVTRELPLTFYPGSRSLSPTPEPVPGNSVMAVVNSSTNSYGETTPDRVGLDENDQAGPNTIMAIISRRPVDPSSAEALRRLGPQDDLPPIPALPPEDENGDAASVPTGRSRIAVVGDSDFATNSFFHILGNGTLFANTVSYLAAQENLIGIEPRTYDLPRVNLTNRQMKGTLFPDYLAHPRHPGRGRHRGLVEAAMNAGRRPRLLVVWLVFVVLVGAVILIERSDLMAPEDEHGGHEEREVAHADAGTRWRS